MPYRRISAYACPSRSRGCRETNVPVKFAKASGMKIGGKGFGIEATHSEKSRDAVDLGLAEIPDIRERNG